MRDRPEGMNERDLARALTDGWGLAGWTLEYAPVGAGSYHWTAAGAAPGERRFVTVDDLDDKGWLGHTRPAALAGLRTAMDAALALRRQAGLGFVVAPVPAVDGQPVQPLGARHAVTVFPFLAGRPGEWGELLTAPERADLIALLAALHHADPVAVRIPRVELALPWRADLEAALAELGRPWTGGPYSEQARALLAGAAGPVRRHLDTLDRSLARVAAAPAVITHGEPHPGNVIRLPAHSGSAGDVGPEAGRLALIDWDTVGLAPPERDLWSVATASGDEVRRYTELTGRPVDPATLEFYRLRWALDDLSCFLRDLRAPHRQTPGIEDAWQNLQATLADLPP